MNTLTALPNIGKTLARQLEEVGIPTEEELRRVGSREAWVRILARDPSACLSRLSALEGALRGVRWHNLTPEVKSELKSFYRQYRPGTGKQT